MSIIVKILLDIQHKIKLYHWSTKIYSRHIASDNLHKRLVDLTDSFIEKYIARYSRDVLKIKNDQINLKTFTDKEMQVFLEKDVKDFLINVIPKHIHPSKDTDLINIRDEMLAEINQALYLFSLN
jgi:hypothetical protein